jgi:hypothetical protein
LKLATIVNLDLHFFYKFFQIRDNAPAIAIYGKANWTFRKVGYDLISDGRQNGRAFETKWKLLCLDCLSGG